MESLSSTQMNGTLNKQQICKTNQASQFMSQSTCAGTPVEFQGQCSPQNLDIFSMVEQLSDKKSTQTEDKEDEVKQLPTK